MDINNTGEYIALGYYNGSLSIYQHLGQEKTMNEMDISTDDTILDHYQLKPMIYIDNSSNKERVTISDIHFNKVPINDNGDLLLIITRLDGSCQLYKYMISNSITTTNTAQLLLLYEFKDHKAPILQSKWYDFYSFATASIDGTFYTYHLSHQAIAMINAIKDQQDLNTKDMNLLMNHIQKSSYHTKKHQEINSFAHVKEINTTNNIKKHHFAIGDIDGNLSMITHVESTTDSITTDIKVLKEVYYKEALHQQAISIIEFNQEEMDTNLMLKELKHDKTKQVIAQQKSIDNQSTTIKKYHHKKIPLVCAIGSLDTTISIYDCNIIDHVYHLIYTFTSHIHPITSINFSSYLPYLLATASHERIYIWSIKDGVLVRTFRTLTDNGGINTIQFNKENRKLAAAMSNGQVIILDIVE